jgi:hypothetical protein
LQILLACDWDYQAFVKECIRLAGAVIAAKTILTMYALKSLHYRDLSPVDMDYLGPPITGVENDNTIVKVLHPSLPVTGFVGILC